MRTTIYNAIVSGGERVKIKRLGDSLGVGSDLGKVLIFISILPKVKVCQFDGECNDTLHETHGHETGGQDRTIAGVERV